MVVMHTGTLNVELSPINAEVGEAMKDPRKHSPLEKEHETRGARMVPFAGWSMPVQYAGILAEHRAVRERVGVFDISHMGQVFVSGAEAASWLEGLLTNRVARLEESQGQYTLLLNERGGVIDDLIVYRTGEQSFFLVVNAAKTGEDVAWLREHAEDAAVEVDDRSESYGGIAVQGPQARDVYAAMTGGGPKLPARFALASRHEEPPVWVCRTGYTGEDGFELFAGTGTIADWWRRALEGGAEPCGLGARDSLRLEKCYPLNGNDLSPDHTPLEAGLGFAVDLEKGDFMGREALVRQKEDGVPRRLVAVRVTGKAPPPRPGYGLLRDGETVGSLTSGGLSPGLGCGIGMGYVDTGAHRAGTALEMEARGKRFPLEVVKKPFVES